MGIVSEVRGSEVVIGSEKLLTGMGIEVPEDVKKVLAVYRSQGYTLCLSG